MSRASNLLAPPQSPENPRVGSFPKLPNALSSESSGHSPRHHLGAVKQGAQKRVWLWDVRGRLTRQNKVPAKTLETQVLGPALPPPSSVALGKYPTPQASTSPRGEGCEHEFLEASSQLSHYRISILLTRITGFDTVQPAGSAPQSRGQHLAANKLVPPAWKAQPCGPSPASPDGPGPA